MENEGGSENLVRIKADASGLDVSVGKGLPDLFGRLLPMRFRVRHSIDTVITDRIIEKFRSGSDLSDAELGFADDFLSDHARKFLRLNQIQQRATEIIEETSLTPKLIGSGETDEVVNSEEPSDVSTTSDDWVNKFREDASLVDDDLVREIYARVLSGEAQSPGSFSLRTLGVLRYLDREAATAFGLLQKVVLDEDAVPQQQATHEHILPELGLNHSTMLMLNDAGLVNAYSQSQRIREGSLQFIRLTGNRLVLLKKEDESSFKITLPVHLLTPAGKQLARIASCDPDSNAFQKMINWLRSNVGDAKIYSATLPSRDWNGPLSELKWESEDSLDNIS